MLKVQVLPGILDVDQHVLSFLTNMASLFPQRLATDAEKFQMEHVWRDDSEVSELT